jgi:REP element-mobilizing transposase RayT
VSLPICPLPHELDKSLRDCAAQNSAEEVCRFQEKADHIPLLEGNRTSQPFPLNPTGTLLRRHLAQFVITKYRDKVQEVASSHRLQREFPDMRKRTWGRHFWARGSFSTTCGNITDDVILQYLREHEPPGGTR